MIPCQNHSTVKSKILTNQNRKNQWIYAVNFLQIWFILKLREKTRNYIIEETVRWARARQEVKLILQINAVVILLCKRWVHLKIASMNCHLLLSKAINWLFNCHRTALISPNTKTAKNTQQKTLQKRQNSALQIALYLSTLPEGIPLYLAK